MSSQPPSAEATASLLMQSVEHEQDASRTDANHLRSDAKTHVGFDTVDKGVRRRLSGTIAREAAAATSRNISSTASFTWLALALIQMNYEFVQFSLKRLNYC